MKFHIETNNTNTWTGVAFSDNRQMVMSDVTQTAQRVVLIFKLFSSRNRMRLSVGMTSATVDRS